MVGTNGSVVLVKVEVSSAEIVPGIGILRLKTDCFLEGMHRLIVSAKVVVDHAEILPGRGFLRLQTDGFLIVWIA